MAFYITPYPYRMARRWAQAAYCEPEEDFALAVNLHEDKDDFVLTAFVPGLKAEDLNIHVLEDVVTIAGEFKTDETEYLKRELPYGSFHRSLRLPTQVNPEKAEAKITDGQLTLRLPKAESARPKTIKVTAK